MRATGAGIRSAIRSLGCHGLSNFASALRLLNGRARHRAVRAEYAAIPLFGLETLPTTLTVIKKLAGVLRHSFGLLVPTPGARDRGLRDHLRLHSGTST